MVSKTLYGHFGCQKGASLREVKQKATETILRVHPDKRPNVSEKTRKKYNIIFHCANETRKILCDRLRRSVYNELLRKKMLPEHGGIRTNFDKLNEIIDEWIEHMPPDERKTRAAPGVRKKQHQ